MEYKSMRVGGEAEYKGNRRGAPIFHLALAVSYTVGIHWLSSIPGNIDPEQAAIYGIIAWTPPALQNLLHIPLFGILAWLWFRTLRCCFESRRVLLGWSFLLAAGYGAIDEYHQLQVPGRYASLTDMSLNILGVLLMLWLLSRRENRLG